MYTIVLQPGVGSGVDTWTDEVNPLVNYVTDTELQATGTGNRKNMWLKFDFSSCPAVGFVSATFSMYRSDAGGDRNTYIGAVYTADWVDSTLVWTGQPWPYRNPYIVDAGLVSSGVGWKSYDFTGTVANWANGTWPNYGFNIALSTSDTLKIYSSKYLGDTTLIPKLTLTYRGNGLINAGNINV